MALTDIAFLYRNHNIVDGKITFGYDPTDRSATKLSILRVEGAATQAENSYHIHFFESVAIISKTKIQILHEK